MISYLKGLSPKKAEALAIAGIERLEDLVFHFPGRYLDARELVPLAEIRKHLRKPVSVRGKVLTSRLIPGRRRARAEIVLMDDSGGTLQLVFFDYPDWRVKQFTKGEEYLIAGYPAEYRQVAQIVQPPFIEHLANPEEFVKGQMLPLYYLSPALRKAGFRDKPFRELIQNAIQKAEKEGLLQETFPDSLLNSEHLFPRSEAVREAHRPQNPERLELARKRLKYEELFFLQLRLALERRRVRSEAKHVVTYDVSHFLPALDGKQIPEPGIAEQVLHSLPYQLTGDQLKALKEILRDMSKADGRTYPTNRLLQGDVGSGKTVVALLAMLAAIENGYQCAFMAPTEVLAAQHYETVSTILKNTSVNTTLLIGGQGKKERKQILGEIARGEVHIVVGTHALIQDKVAFHKLGFVVTDEQHRFGVAQRKALVDKGAVTSNLEELDDELFRISLHTPEQVTPDVLLMTATPIPRTLALTLYGDMEVSTIRELPKGRKPIKTMLFFEQDHPQIYKAALRRIEQKGEQVFIVYPLREKSQKVDSEAAEKGYEELRKKELKDVRVGLVHGKMSSIEKQDVMRRFREKEFDVLIATTVIEVGVDVPNATVMIIEHAERFGLAQLHQLRGRVGRGSADSACVLVASQKLADNTELSTSDEIENNSIALERLKILVETSDGFEIAKADMEFRGTGEILGQKQSGRIVLKIANLTTDTALVEQAMKDAEHLLASDPELRSPANRSTRDEYLRLFRDEESFLHVG